MPDDLGLERFGLDAVDLSMLRSGDRLGSATGAKWAAAIERLLAERPAFEGVARTKLDSLMERGWEVCGYAIVKDEQYGLVTTGAFVGWWSVAADNAEKAEAQRDKLKEALTVAEAVLRQAEPFSTTDDGKIEPTSPAMAAARARQALEDSKT